MRDSAPSSSFSRFVISSSLSFSSAAAAARSSSPVFNSRTLSSINCSRSARRASAFVSSSFASRRPSSSIRRSAIRRSRSSSSASVSANAVARRSKAADCSASSCSSCTSRPDVSIWSFKDARSSCSRAREAFSSARSVSTSRVSTTGAAAAIASAGDLASGDSVDWSFALSPLPKPPSVPCSATATPAPLELEELREVEECRAEDHEEHRREDEQDRREEHLDRRFRRLFLRDQLALESCVAGLNLEDAAERDTELVGLDNRAHEARHLRRRAALGHLLERAPAAFADADLTQCELELLDQWAFHVLRELLDGTIETKPGLHAHGEEIERVRQLRRDRGLPRLDPGVEVEVRSKRSQATEEERHEEHVLRCHRSSEHRPEDEPADGQDALGADNRGRRRVPHPGRHQLGRNRGGGDAGIDAQNKPRDVSYERVECAVAEARQLSTGGATRATVVGSLVHEVPTVPHGRGSELREVED